KVNSADLPSVDRYIAYLRATATDEGESKPKRKGSEEPTGIWDAIRHHLQDRVDGNGLYLGRYLDQALAQRAQMKGLPGSNLQLPNGMWEFIGPRNLKTTSPSRIYQGVGPL